MRDDRTMESSDTTRVHPARLALQRLAEGRPIIVTGRDEPGEQPHVCVPADGVSADDIVFMATRVRGLVSVAIPESRAAALNIRLQPMSIGNRVVKRFGVSVEAATGVTTGISAADRALTARTLADETSDVASFTRPGHIFPVVVAERGVLVRRGVAEAAVDLTRLAGHGRAVVLCELLDEAGDVADEADVQAFAAEHDLPVVDVEDVFLTRLYCDRIVEPVVEAALPTVDADFRVIAFRSLVDGAEHMVLVRGDPTPDPDSPTYIHQHCVAGAFGSTKCDCHERLAEAMSEITSSGCGAIVYLSGRSLPLSHTRQPELDEVDRAIARQILRSVRAGRPARAPRERVLRS